MLPSLSQTHIRCSFSLSLSPTHTITHSDLSTYTFLSISLTPTTLPLQVPWHAISIAHSKTQYTHFPLSIYFSIYPSPSFTQSKRITHTIHSLSHTHTLLYIHCFIPTYLLLPFPPTSTYTLSLSFHIHILIYSPTHCSLFLSLTLTSINTLSPYPSLSLSLSLSLSRMCKHRREQTLGSRTPPLLGNDLPPCRHTHKRGLLPITVVMNDVD